MPDPRPLDVQLDELRRVLFQVHQRVTFIMHTVTTPEKVDTSILLPGEHPQVRHVTLDTLYQRRVRAEAEAARVAAAIDRSTAGNGRGHDR